MYSNSNNSSNSHPIQEVTVMNCHDVWDLLSAYADGETDAHETEIVESHIATCSDCARDLQFMQGTHVALQALPEVEPPISLRSAILAATVNRPSLTERFTTAVRRGLAPAPVRYGALAAAGAAAALTAVTIRDQKSPVDYVRTSPTVVATVPPAPAPVERAESAPSLDLLDVYEPPTSTARALTPRVRQTRNRSQEPRPAIRMASASTRNPVHPATRLAKANGDTKTKQAATVDEPTGSAVAPAPTTPVMSPEPEPAPRTIVASSETAPNESATAPAIENAGRSARIVLTASRVTLDPAQAATLADLRRSLGQHSNGAVSAANLGNARDRQIRVDVIRGSF